MSDILKIQDLDPFFKDELAQEPGCQHLRRCFSCGVCTASCPVSELEPGFSPSLIIRHVLYGLKGPLLSSPALWYCLRCAQCSFQCPQDVRFLDLIQGLRNMALREGRVSAARVAQLASAERLIQELRRRLIAALLKGPETDVDLIDTLTGLLTDLPHSSGRES
jgi:heterodisulfide reductase subunit C